MGPPVLFGNLQGQPALTFEYADREAGYRDPLAPGRISVVLETEERPRSRAAESASGNTESDPRNEHR